MEKRQYTLEDWLSDHDARPLWDRVIGRSEFTGYVVNGRFIIVQEFNKHDEAAPYGWEVYIPASASNLVSATLEVLTEYIEDD